MEPIKVITTILGFTASKAIAPLSRQKIIIEILQKLNLYSIQPPSDFEGVFNHALVEYAVDKQGNIKPEPILNFWREKEIKAKFWQAFNDNPRNFYEDAEYFQDWHILGDEIRANNINVRQEIEEFYRTFCSVAERSRPPKDVNFKKLPEKYPYPDEFKSLIEEKIKSFCGRLFVFAEFAKFQQEHSKGYFTVIGDAGMGKSSIAAKYVSDNHCPCYFNILAERRNRPDDFIKSMRRQLIQIYGLQDCENANLQELLEKAIQVHRKNYQNQQNQLKKLIIIVDALDEVEQPDGAENILYLPEYLPEGVYFFLTRRPYDNSQKRLKLQVPERELDLNSEEYQTRNLADIQACIRLFLSDSEYRDNLQKWIQERQISPDNFITEVATKSENNFMYLRYILPGIAGGYYNDLSLDKLPKGLEDYYQQHWVRMGMEKQPKEIQVIILYIIVEWNTPPISLRDIVEISGKDEYEVEEVLEEWREYLKVQSLGDMGKEEKFYRVYHASFLDFLKAQRKLDGKRKLFEEVNGRIADYVYR
ncbi:AAA family ATPase [Calothrix sp. 336/3]|uniref:AAA family ATPase n=1 Tax=Calothrix sp. 336/3 TaxID=1337936 RepID=UPI0004E383D7|nr:AAA family ATPase [Calothrix sp. 336/3]AKG20701.1 hypothetical protein IJ00_04720 [Calothrix sp. 336/3]